MKPEELAKHWEIVSCKECRWLGRVNPEWDGTIRCKQCGYSDKRLIAKTTIVLPADKAKP